MAVSLIAGLGNPGIRYAETRHNIGFMLIDALALQHGCSWAAETRFEALTSTLRIGERKIFLLKPQTYVNRSGQSVDAICRYYRIPSCEVVVAYDEINLPLGRVKISVSGSAGGHNGIAHLLRYLAGDFIRFRLGIGPKAPPEIDMKDFVLGKFSTEGRTIITEKLPEFLEGLQLLIDRGPDMAMNHVNQRK
ncbi:MAG: aminoacyl-tRNA hydrolase [Opitutales bacterium]